MAPQGGLRKGTMIPKRLPNHTVGLIKDITHMNPCLLNIEGVIMILHYVFTKK